MFQLYNSKRNSKVSKIKTMQMEIDEKAAALLDEYDSNWSLEE